MFKGRAIEHEGKNLNLVEPGEIISNILVAELRFDTLDQEPLKR